MMSYRSFVIPEYHEFVDVIGKAPEPITGQEPAQRLSLESDGEMLVATFDEAGRSVHCRWTRGERVLSEVFQEGAVLLRLEKSGERVELTIDLEHDDFKGRLTLIMAPEFGLVSHILLR